MSARRRGDRDGGSGRRISFRGGGTLRRKRRPASRDGGYLRSERRSDDGWEPPDGPAADGEPGEGNGDGERPDVSLRRRRGGTAAPMASVATLGALLLLVLALIFLL